MRSTPSEISKRFKRSPRNRIIAAIDLFCGVGGLTKGLEKAGIEVRLGVDIDPACAYPYEANNEAAFLLQSVADLNATKLHANMKGAGFKLLAGCAPCQPFSTYHQKSGPSDERWHLLGHFGRLAKELDPDIITMENVPNLAKQSVFKKFVSELEALDFNVAYEVVNCAEFGVPQQRQRLVLLASKLGPISLLRTKSKPKTVRKAIEGLPAIEAGEVCETDPLHQASELSDLNMRRIRASTPGGTWRDWKKELVADCHKRPTGKTYPSVYGRMEWDEPAPTITTQYFGFGNGRFGHPEQDRAISLREGAILQSFPKSYKFVKSGDPIYCKTIGRLIGNAVPVKLAEAIGKSIVAHVEMHTGSQKRAA
ncbi:DNA cytosine methyltransferase [Mesorhizobium sp. M0060]|uniref:DNA cytosine methyltransferase n=1 Tax=Mesorhizobium sp. M0060 TaxID=2956866 RepID=UPI00333D4750